MRIVHITPAFSPAIGGIETSVRELTRSLRAEGVCADILHMAPAIRKKSRETEGQFTIWRVPLQPNRLIGLTPPIRSILSSYDILHVHDPQQMSISANVLAQGRGIKKVLSTRGGYFHTSDHAVAKAIHWRLIARHLLAGYDEVLASSCGDYETFKNKAPQIKLVPNGVNISQFLKVGRTRGLAVNRWIYWGRLARNKRIDLLIDSVKLARDAGIQIDLLIAGPDFDGLAPSLKARIASHGLNSQIRLSAGPLPEREILAALAERAVFVTATEYEGFGNTIIEAMAAGLLVICRDMSPLNGVVAAAKNGLFLRFDSSADDLKSIRTLCSSPGSEVLKMQECSRTSALDHSWENVIKKYLQVYENLMRQPPANPR